MSSDSRKPARTDSQEQPCERQWTSSIPEIASEDIIDIGDSRYAHFRRDRRFAQVQVMFTAPEGVDPNPGRELTDQFKEQGWRWQPDEPGKPWIYQLEQSSKYDLTARGDSHDVLYEQFLIIIQEYREKHGKPPVLGWQNFTETDTRDADPDLPSISPMDGQAFRNREKQTPQSAEEETRAGGPAATMLAAFASVGGEQFDITLTDVAGGKVGFRGNRPLDEVQSAIPAILQEAAERQHNVIVRPRSAGAMLIQLDDLARDAAERLRSVSFLVICSRVDGQRGTA